MWMKDYMGHKQQPHHSSSFLFCRLTLDKIQITPQKDRNSEWLQFLRRLQISRMWRAVSPMARRGPSALLWMFVSFIARFVSVRGPGRRAGSWTTGVPTKGCNRGKKGERGEMLKPYPCLHCLYDTCVFVSSINWEKGSRQPIYFGCKHGPDRG